MDECEFYHLDGEAGRGRLEIKVSFHVGHSPTKFYINVCWRCSHVQVANQPHYGGLLECGGLWTWAARLPCAH